MKKLIKKHLTVFTIFVPLVIGALLTGFSSLVPLKGYMLQVFSMFFAVAWYALAYITPAKRSKILTAAVANSLGILLFVAYLLTKNSAVDTLLNAYLTPVMSLSNSFLLVLAPYVEPLKNLMLAGSRTLFYAAAQLLMFLVFLLGV